MAGWKEWAIGEVVEAGDMQSYIQDQTVMVFASSAARSTAIGTAVSEGMFTYLLDTDALEYYDGSAWAGVGGLPSQSGNAGKYLTTDGSDASWETIVTDPTPTVFLLMGA